MRRWSQINSGAYFPICLQAKHPGLQFKKLEGQEDIYSAPIGLGSFCRIDDDKEIVILLAKTPSHGSGAEQTRVITPRGAVRERHISLGQRGRAVNGS